MLLPLLFQEGPLLGDRNVTQTVSRAVFLGLGFFAGNFFLRYSLLKKVEK